MKSQSTKKRRAREAKQAAEAREAREKDPNLIAVYLAFLPSYLKRGTPKYSTDKYGNRVRTGEKLESK